MTTYNTHAAARWVGLASLVLAVACSGSDPGSTSSQNLLTGGKAQPKGNQGADDHADGEQNDDQGDKVTCSVDADCDSDETCVAGACTGTDGESDDDSADDDTADDDKSDGADDEGSADKVICAVDADCDADETCVSGKCTGTDGESNDDGADSEKADGAGGADGEGSADKVVCAVDTDCDADETCVSGKCTGTDGESDDGADGADDAKD